MWVPLSHLAGICPLCYEPVHFAHPCNRQQNTQTAEYIKSFSPTSIFIFAVNIQAPLSSNKPINNIESIDIVETLQSANKLDAIGQHIIDNNYVEDIQLEYSRLDGYGNHFNHYNGNEVEIYDYYAFRIN